MEANSEEKQLYIKENVTNKGYDSFLFTQFICKKYNQKDFDINKFSIGQIREAIQDFKNNTPLGKITNSSSAPPLQKQKKKNIIQSILGFINEEEQKSNSPKKSEFDYGFRLPEKLKCQNVEEEYLNGKIYNGNGKRFFIKRKHEQGMVRKKQADAVSDREERELRGWDRCSS